MSNYRLLVTLSLGWNGNPLYINDELVEPTAVNLKEKALVEKYFAGASTNTNFARMSFGEVELPFIEFYSESGYPSQWGDPEVPDQQYVMVDFEIPSSVLTELLALLEIDEEEFEEEESIEIERDFDDFGDLIFLLSFDGEDVRAEVRPVIAISPL